MTTLDDMLSERPVDRTRVDAHKQRMLDEVRAYHLREIREAASLTQTDVAERLKVSQNRVSRIEHGDLEHTQVDTLRRYVEALGGSLLVEAEINGRRVQIA